MNIGQLMNNSDARIKDYRELLRDEKREDVRDVLREVLRSEQKWRKTLQYHLDIEKGHCYWLTNAIMQGDTDTSTK